MGFTDWAGSAGDLCFTHEFNITEMTKNNSKVASNRKTTSPLL